jgi:hypothetical protein
MNEGFGSAYKKYERIVCADGFSMSVQAGAHSYCEPNSRWADEEKHYGGPYTHVEVGFPNGYDILLAEYAEDSGNYTQTVYPYVPSHIVMMVIDAHGGMASGELPPLKLDDYPTPSYDGE